MENLVLQSTGCRNPDFAFIPWRLSILAIVVAVAGVAIVVVIVIVIVDIFVFVFVHVFVFVVCRHRFHELSAAGMDLGIALAIGAIVLTVVGVFVSSPSIISAVLF